MSKKPIDTAQSPSLKPLTWINGITISLSILGLGIWGWMLNNRDKLPALGTGSSYRLLRQYQATSHDIFLISLALATIALVRLILKFHQREATNTDKTQNKPLQAFLDFAKEQPIALAVFAAYTVAMVHGTTWLYPELVAWYSSVISDQLLNNFAFHGGFISETMRRTDFRFFPLAHQDLHALSWLTPYVKVWMLVSAAELIAITVLSARFVRRLTSTDSTKGPGILIITAILLMFHASTAEAFFQLIYCERLLTVFLALYISSYLHYQKTNSNASFYSTFLFGLIGIFIKDTAAVLFIIPPVTTMLFGLLGWNERHKPLQVNNAKKWLKNYRLELWLLTLVPIFIFSYISLSLLPSAYASQEAYSHGPGKFHYNWRFCFLLLITFSRLTMAGFGRIRLHLLDSMNIASLGYAGAIFMLVGFNSYSYLSFPVHLVATLNIVWLWASVVAPQLNQKMSWRQTASVGMAAALLGLMIESRPGHPSFTESAEFIKHRQASWLGAYSKAIALSREIRQNGEPVNIIYNRNSWLNRRRHLGRINYDRLIEFDPTENTFLIEDGIDRGSVYTPSAGDLILNIDRPLRSLDPILTHGSYEQLYRYGSYDGAIYRLRSWPQH